MPMLAPSAPSTPTRSQADALRVGRDRSGSESTGPATLLMASGRGGSGTTLVSTLLAVSAAGNGVRVLLIDADDLVGPLALTLGVTPRASWTDLRGGRTAPADVVTPVSTTLTFVAGGAPLWGGEAMTMNAPERKACMRRLSVLADDADLVVVDCGARFDSLLAAIAPHANERLVAISSGSDPIGLAATYALCKAVGQRHSAFPVDVLVNHHDVREATRCFDAIDAGARQFLGRPLRLAGAVPTDSTLDAALRAGMPFLDAAAGSPAAVAAHEIVMRMLANRPLPRSGV
jgi:flagellar biosynthesis protein FlhG